MVGKKKKDALITIVIIRVLLKTSEFCVVDYFSNISLFLMLKRGEKTLEANERVKILLPLQNDYLWNNCCSVTQSCPTLRHHGLKLTRLPYLSPSPRVCSNSCSLSPWFHPTILSYVVPFSSCFQSFPALVSFPMNQLFTSGGQSIRASASASVLPMNIQGWFPLGLTGLISLLSKGLSRVFSSTRVRRHQFFGAQHFWLSSSFVHTWLLEKIELWLYGLCRQRNVFAF